MAQHLARALPVAVLVALLIVLLLAADGWLFGVVRDLVPDGSWQQRVLRLAKWPLGVVASVILAVLLLIHPSRVRLLVAFASVYVLAVGSLHLLKFFIGRARPDLGLGPYFFEPFGDARLGFDSFPSGHALQAFLTALLIQHYLPRVWRVPVLLAFLVAVSRVAVGRHYPSDVVAGALLAVASIAAVRLVIGRDSFPNLTRAQLAEGWDALRRRFSKIRTVTSRPRE